MDGSPQVVRFDATTLWHFDAAEWAPSTASFSSDRHAPAAHAMSASLRKRTCANWPRYVRFVPKADSCTAAKSISIRSPCRHTNIGPIVHQFCALSRAVLSWSWLELKVA